MKTNEAEWFKSYGSVKEFNTDEYCVTPVVKALSELYQTDSLDFYFKKVIAEGYSKKPTNLYRWLVMVFFWLCYQKILNWIKPIPKPKEYKIGWKCYNQDGGFSGIYRHNDFILNDQIQKEDVLFCCSGFMSDKYLSDLRESGNNFCTIKRGRLSPVQVKRLSTTLRQLLIHGFKTHLVEATTQILIREYILWCSFLNEYKIDKYVFYNDTWSWFIPRNILLKNAGVETFMYLHSMNYSSFYFGKEVVNKYYDHLSSYYYLDNLIFWGKGVSLEHTSNPNKISAIHEIGVPWQGYPQVGKLKIKQDKVVSFFDTAIGITMSFMDLLTFLDDIVKLSETQEDLYLIYKGKHSQEYLDTILSEEECRELCCRKSRLWRQTFNATDLFNVSDILNMSNIAVSIAFTSPAIEALAMGKKGFFYDPGGRFAESQYLQIPNFVARNNVELNQYIDFWLGISDQDFKTWRDKHIIPNVLSHCDGRGVDRFRALLRG